MLAFGFCYLIGALSILLMIVKGSASASEMLLTCELPCVENFLPAEEVSLLKASKQFSRLNTVIYLFQFQ